MLTIRFLATSVSSGLFPTCQILIFSLLRVKIFSLPNCSLKQSGVIFEHNVLSYSVPSIEVCVPITACSELFSFCVPYLKSGLFIFHGFHLYFAVGKVVEKRPSIVLFPIVYHANLLSSHS